MDATFIAALAIALFGALYVAWRKHGRSLGSFDDIERSTLTAHDLCQKVKQAAAEADAFIAAERHAARRRGREW